MPNKGARHACGKGHLLSLGFIVSENYKRDNDDGGGDGKQANNRTTKKNFGSKGASSRIRKRRRMCIRPKQPHTHYTDPYCFVIRPGRLEHETAFYDIIYLFLAPG